MSKLIGSLWMVALALSFIALDTQSAAAQGFNIGGLKQSTNKKQGGNQGNNQSNHNHGDDDEDHSNHQQGGRQSQSNKSNGEQAIEQFFPGGIPGGQGKNNQGQGQGGSNQFRRSNQQGQFPGQQFPGNPQFQNRQQGNQNNITIGTWNGNKWQGSRNVDNWTKHYGGNQKPFSNQWYQDHPKAWKYDNNNSNVWVVATMPGVYNWLGWGNVPQQYNVGYGNSPQFDRSHYGDWYPLGVYSLMTGPGDPGTRMVQLAVDQHGHVGGNYYDMITNSNYSLSGDVKRQSQNVYWSLNKNQAIRFKAHISQLLQPYGTITVQMPGGDQQWQFVRLEN